MSDRGNQSIRQGANAAKNAGKTGYRAGSALTRRIPLKVRLIALGIILFLLLISVLVGGTSSTSMDETWYLTAENEKDAEHQANRPETEEELDSVVSQANSIEITARLAAIINQARADDRRVIEARIQKNHGSDKKTVIIDCETDTAPVYYSEVASATAAGSAEAPSTLAEKIALTAEQWSWPEGTPKASYRRQKGGSAYGNFTEAYRKWYPQYKNSSDTSVKVGSCCCHFARTVVAEAAGQKISKTLLPNKSGNAKAKLEDIMTPLGFEIFEWDGKESSLKRGDVCSYANKSGGGHVYIYLGNGRVSEAGHSGWFGHIAEFKGNKSKKGNKTWYYVMRCTDGAAAVSSASTVGTGNSSPGTTSQTYNSIKTLQTLSKNTGTRKTLPAAGGYAYQSFAYGNGYFYLQQPRRGARGSNGYIRVLDKSMKQIKVSDHLGIRHGNGLAFCTADQNLYSVTTTYVPYGGGLSSAGSRVIEAGSLKIKDTKKLDHRTSAIAYDRITNRFITSSGASSRKASGTGYMYVYDSTFSQNVRRIAKKRWKTPGDIAAYNGVIYVCIHEGTGRNHIDMYSEDTGAYLGSYDAPYDEIEGIDFDDNGQMILLFNCASPFLQFTGMTALGGAATPGSAASFAGATGITKSDLELLSAYSISLANSELVFDEKAEAKLFGEGTYGRYFSKPESKLGPDKAVPVKLYWFGEDRGKVNYEKDLKSKVDKWELYDRDWKETEDGDIIHVTLKEKPVTELMEHMFGVDPDALYVNAVTSAGSSATNGRAVYSLAESTAQLLFNGKTVAGGPAAMGAASFGIFPGGTLLMPLPTGTWTKTSDFGYRWGRLHAGVDLGASGGTPIYAAAAGTVVRAEYFSGYGNCVDIDHGNGMLTRYGHQSKLAATKGQVVQAGQLIGYVGNTGHSFGNHLHFEVRINGEPKNPCPYIGIN